MATLAKLLEHGKRAVARPGIERNDTFIVDKNRRNLAGVNGAMSLGRDLMPVFLDVESRIYAPGITAPAGQQTTLERKLAENSRVIEAGANLILMPEKMTAIESGGVVGFRQEPGRFVTIEPANFQAVALDPLTGEGEITAGAMPSNEAIINRDAFTQRAARFTINRATQKALGDGQLSAELMTAIALGIGRAVDAELLAAIVATTPAAFSLANAATAGIKHNELRAIVGTTGAGAQMIEGGLYAAGIKGEFSAATTATIIGAYSRAAIALGDEILFLAERTDAAGNLVVSCWFDVQALLPEPGKFWNVA
ncbi:hypothetical protein [Thiomicrospira aerophila]|nr:hypothetical protein [Thiomicrospira aerophila]